MKLDREQKKARLGEHLPGFPGYRTIDIGDTDLQLRRLLSAEMEKVRDRLAEFVAGAEAGRLAPGFTQALRTTAALKDSFSPRPEERRVLRTLPPREEERLFDLDLALLERIAALHTVLDRLEAAGSSTELAAGLTLLEEGLAEAEELYRRREEFLYEWSGKEEGT